MADAGMELFRVGRDAEAEAFCEEGVRFWGMSLREEEWEEREKRRRRGYESDVEMDLGSDY